MLAPAPLLRTLETQAEEAERRIKNRYKWSQMEEAGFKKPRFGSSVYKDYVQKGLITPEEQAADRIRQEIRAERTGQRKQSLTCIHVSARAPRVSMPMRWANETPIPSKQYAKDMSTKAARDRRLTGEAKALLLIIRARCGSGTKTETTKATLASTLGRSTRSIQRYLKDLAHFGYIVKDERRNNKGFYTGLVLWLTHEALPFFRDVTECGKWIAGKFAGQDMPFPTGSETDCRQVAPVTLGNLDKTVLSFKNLPNKDSLIYQMQNRSWTEIIFGNTT